MSKTIALRKNTGSEKLTLAPLQPRDIFPDLLVVDRDRAELMRRWRTWVSQNEHRFPDDAWKQPHKHHELAREWLKVLPSLPEIRNTKFHDAGWKRIEADQLDILIALMVDGLPNARPKNMAAYLDALALTITEVSEPKRPFNNQISVHAVAAAVKAVWAELDFAPSPKEFLAKCKVAAERFQDAQVLALQLEDCRRSAEAVLIVLGELQHYSCYPDPTEDNYDDAAELRELYAEHLQQQEQQREAEERQRHEQAEHPFG